MVLHPPAPPAPSPVVSEWIQPGGALWMAQMQRDQTAQMAWDDMTYLHPASYNRAKERNR